jgi:hypothetical protein
MKIYEKMAAITRDFPVVTKDNKNPSQGYSYRGIDDALGALHGLLAKHGVFLSLCELVPEFHDGGTTKSGTKQTRCIVTGKVRFIAGEDGSFVESALMGEGLDTGDKAAMKAQANALKYVIWYTFAVPTDEKKDSEAFEDPEPAPTPLRTKRAATPPKDSLMLEHTLAITGAKTPGDLATVWAGIRPELVQMPADSPDRTALVAAYKKRQAELVA